ncbi:MAG TPA: aminotransferase class V-fold PLP-dependent enzyme [Streptosporangiaceae bacterium]|nr:aminotransferase class V-fold PLP-dependent enzyme [Streptosporangiaceae bacterium]
MTFKRRRSGTDRAERRGGLPAGPPVSSVASASLDVQAIREHFAFPRRGRIVTNNAASTQPPDELLALYQSLAPGYENVHRGQSSASQAMTALFEESYDTIARFIGAPGRAGIALYRNTTEAINAVMYSLLTEFRDGDNVVSTMMEHNSNYVPWYALCQEILPRFGRRVQCRLARFDPVTGELDLDHLASLIDARTKLVCCTGASNFLGTRNPLAAVRALADASGYHQPNGERRSWLLIDGAQLVPGSFTDVHALGADYLSFSFHKLLAPFGVGVLYAREQLLNPSLPFLYGGDMIAEGQVFPHHVEYNALPWKYSAGTPNILGAVVSAQALRMLLDLALTPKRPAYFGTARSVEREAVQAAMSRVAAWNQMLTSRALDGLGAIDGITIYGPRDAARRTSLVAFNLAGRDAVSVAAALNEAGIESRAGCHCATLAHHALGLNPPASCRLSFYLYNTPGEVDRAVEAVAAIAADRGLPGRDAPGPRFRSWAAGRHRTRQHADHEPVLAAST